MSFKTGLMRDTGESEGRVLPGAGLGSDDGGLQDPELEQALRDFRASVHAWSEAVFPRARVMEVAPRRVAWLQAATWRRAAAWALGTVLVATGAGGGLLEYQHRQEQARMAAAREVQRQRQLEEERARQAEQELAQVDRDVSREVPDALEPLAQLMGQDESQ